MVGWYLSEQARLALHDLLALAMLPNAANELLGELGVSHQAVAHAVN